MCVYVSRRICQTKGNRIEHLASLTIHVFHIVIQTLELPLNYEYLHWFLRTHNAADHRENFGWIGDRLVFNHKVWRSDNVRACFPENVGLKDYLKTLLKRIDISVDTERIVKRALQNWSDPSKFHELVRAEFNGPDDCPLLFQPPTVEALKSHPLLLQCVFQNGLLMANGKRTQEDVSRQDAK